MPAQDQSSKVGTSSSPVINSAIQTGKNSQACTTSVSDALSKQFIDTPIDVKKIK